ncbi:hypothetical protein [Rickettsia amblyommatis]|uniref:Uncharacterized protein n=1 Tax=Rickettsia amblyommatis str. Ac/Pa TaxID=1359164 RepID=A0A0F3N319_RICAM|nr:hypothetical protein [Rickettsia amblyommatis]KJV62480.1 hypothetical protein APHACPA_1509 [Rickettsia amblyommatis str. Ac/Pa]
MLRNSDVDALWKKFETGLLIYALESLGFNLIALLNASRVCSY